MSSDDVIPLLTSALSEIMDSGKKSCEKKQRTVIIPLKRSDTHLHDKEASSPPVTSSSNQSVSGEHDKLHKDKYTPHLPPIMILWFKTWREKKKNVIK